MTYGTFFKFHHTIELFSKQETVSPAGQLKHSFVFKDAIPAIVEYERIENLNSPYIANFDEINILIPKNFIDIINYNLRIKNIKDRYSNIIDSSYFDILSINKKMQYSGKVHHIVIRARKVVESSD